MEPTASTSDEHKGVEECGATSMLPPDNFINVRRGGSLNYDSDDSDSEMEFHCKVCDKFFSGLKPLRQHEKSGKHIKVINRRKLQREIDEDLKTGDDPEGDDWSLGNKFAECDICKKEFTGPESYHQHLRSKGHKKKSAEKRILDQAREDGVVEIGKLKQLLKNKENSGSFQSDLLEPESDINIFKCDECNKVFTGLEPFYAHLNSKTHEKTLKQKALHEKLTSDGKDVSIIKVEDEDLICKICRLSFSGPESALTHLKSRGHLKMLEIRKWKKEQKKLKAEAEKESTDTESEKESSDDSSENEESKEENDSKNEDVLKIPTEVANEEISKKNTLLAYKSYKNYKEIIESEKCQPKNS